MSTHLDAEFEFDNLQHQITMAKKYIGTIKLKNQAKLKYVSGKENTGPGPPKQISSLHHQTVQGDFHLQN